MNNNPYKDDGGMDAYEEKELLQHLENWKGESVEIEL